MPPLINDRPFWARRVRRRMQELGVTQRQLAPILGVRTQGAVGHYLMGRRELSIDQLQALAMFLDLNLEVLLNPETGEGDRETYPWAGEPNFHQCRGVPVYSWQNAGLNHYSGEAEDSSSRGHSVNCPIPCSPHSFATRVHGREGEPYFREGELIVCDPLPKPQHNDFLLVRINYDTLPVIRRLSVEGGRELLYPVNDRVPAPILVLDDLSHPLQAMIKIIARMEFF